MAVQEIARCGCCGQIVPPHELGLTPTQQKIYDLVFKALTPPDLKTLSRLTNLDSDLLKTHISKMNVRLKLLGLYIGGSRTRGAAGYKLVAGHDVVTRRFLGPQHVGRAGTVSDLWGCPMPDVWPRITRRLPVGSSVAVVLEDKPVRKEVSAPRDRREPERHAAADVDGVPSHRRGKARELAAPYGQSQNPRSPQR